MQGIIFGLLLVSGSIVFLRRKQTIIMPELQQAGFSLTLGFDLEALSYKTDLVDIGGL